MALEEPRDISEARSALNQFLIEELEDLSAARRQELIDGFLAASEKHYQAAINLPFYPSYAYFLFKQYVIQQGESFFEYVSSPKFIFLLIPPHSS